MVKRKEKKNIHRPYARLQLYCSCPGFVFMFVVDNWPIMYTYSSTGYTINTYCKLHQESWLHCCNFSYVPKILPWIHQIGYISIQCHTLKHKSSVSSCFLFHIRDKLCQGFLHLISRSPPQYSLPSPPLSPTPLFSHYLPLTPISPVFLALQR